MVPHFSAIVRITEMADLLCSADGYGARVSFDENGDSKGRYNIMNFRRNRATRRYEYVTVGRWADELHIDVGNYGINRITWAGGDGHHFRSRTRYRIQLRPD